MKIELTEEQVFFGRKKTTRTGSELLPLQSEILDHICCMAENEMQNGQTFEQAHQAIFEIFGKDELKELQQQTIFFTHQKSQRMKNIALVVLQLFIISIYGFLFQRIKKNQLQTEFNHLLLRRLWILKIQL